MKVYHSGFNIIEKPDLDHGRANADFSKGFYLSPDKEFVLRWAKFRKGETTYINTYELETEGLSIRVFHKEEAWFEYIFNNRHFMKDLYEEDVIIGPIANDTIYDTFGIISSGLLSTKEAMALLMIGEEYTQVVLKSQRALEQLRFIESEIVKEEDIREYQAMLKKEEEEFQKQFVACLQKM